MSKFNGALSVSIVLLLGVSHAIIRESVTPNTLGPPHGARTPMHKVEMTQQGYIQFLRWQLPVPEFHEFTFCLWVKSNNLTHAHPIFSYSKDEKERLIRGWISPFGRSIHMEIGNVEIFDYPIAMVEGHWYHICQSWQGPTGRYGLWIDGAREIDGNINEMAGHVIPKGGDIVVGQEYTDFDKGLEDGIEGAVQGFNLVLASAFSGDPVKFEDDYRVPVNAFKFPQTPAARLPGSLAVDYAQALADKRDLAFLGIDDYSGEADEEQSREDEYLQKVKRTARSLDTLAMLQEKSPGLRLVEESFAHCQIGRGSPFIDESIMLISWTRTPVRVFGGAILKNVKSEQCGQF